MGDDFILVPNAAGLGLGLVQLAVYRRFSPFCRGMEDPAADGLGKEALLSCTSDSEVGASAVDPGCGAAPESASTVTGTDGSPPLGHQSLTADPSASAQLLEPAVADRGAGQRMAVNGR